MTGCRAPAPYNRVLVRTQPGSAYKRHGVVNRVAALAVHPSKVPCREVDRNTGANFLKFLKYLDRKYRHVTIHLMLDNLSVHKQKDVMAWLAKKRKFHVHDTPTYAS